MKKTILIALCILFIKPSNVFGADLESVNIGGNKSISIAASEVIDDDYIAAAETIELSGTINGDVYVMGGMITINGQIAGDLLAIGGQIIINGTIMQNIRAIGGDISINGQVGNNMTIGSGNVEIGPNASISGNLLLGAGNVKLGAPVSGDVKVAAENITLGSAVKGDLLYWSDSAENLSLVEGATVSGNITYRQLPGEVHKWRDQMNMETFNQSLKQLLNLARLGGFIGMLLVGFLIIHFFPNYSVRAIKSIELKGVKSLLLGFATLILTPFVIIFLMFSLIGIPVAVLLLIIYGIYLYIAKIIISYWLGARLLNRLNREASKTVTYLIGAGIYYILTAFVIIGPIVMFFSMVFGLGGMLLADHATYLKARRSRLF